MTQDEKRIKIAEACGWWGNVNGLLMRPPLNNSEYHEVPDYFNDLNAIHEAIQVLDYEQSQHFYNELWVIVVHDLGEAENPQPVRFAVTCATAEQRAEAFGKTLNLW